MDSLAVGVLVAQFLAYADVSDDLADAKARLKELDTTEAKRAYLDDRIQDARSLIEDVAAQGVDWYGQNIRILADLEHWETVVRAEIRKAWGHKPAQRFAAHTETNKPDIYRRFEPADVIQKYIERRIARLTELRDETR